MRRFLITALLLAGAPSAMADEDTGFYFGAGAGQGRLSADDLPAELTSTGWKAFGGYRLDDNFSLEAAYIDGGEISVSDGTVTASIETTMLQLSAVGTYWVADNIGLYARVGANNWDATATLSAFGESLGGSESGTDFGWGVGLGTTWDNIAMRVEYESVAIEEIDAAFLSVSFAWNFGGRDRDDKYSDRPVASQATQQPAKDGVRVYE